MRPAINVAQLRATLQAKTMTIGVYEETLPGGYGRLRVFAAHWEIVYYFSGPDLRYKGTTVTIPSQKLAEYIQAFKDSWSELEKLRVTLPEGGQFSKGAKLGITIRAGGYPEGLCLAGYHVLVSSKAELDALLKSYSYAQSRAAEVQKLFSSLV